MNFRSESFFRVGGALALGTLLIGGSLLAHHKSVANTKTEAAAIRAVSEHVRTALTAEDTDGDGIPDWEEALLGTDPRVVTMRPETTSGDAAIDEEPYEAPSTVTGQFAERFLEDLVRESAGRELSGDERAALIARSISSLTSAEGDTLYTRANVTLSPTNDLAALRAYGNQVAAIMNRHSINNEHELAILQRAVDTDNAAVLRELAPIERAYRNMLRDTLALTAPSALAQEHVNLINTFSIIAGGIGSMQQAFDDPLAALVRVRRYPDDAAGLFYALDNLRIALERRGVVYTKEEPGIFLFSLRP